MDTINNVMLALSLAFGASGMGLGVWGIVKAYAASSSAKWDDEAVAFVEKIAHGVVTASPVVKQLVDKANGVAIGIIGQAPTAGNPAQVAGAAITGVDH